MEKYVIGLDYGTLSGRAVMVSCKDGRTIASATKMYPHGVLEEELPDGTPIPRNNWALQVPADYLEVLETIVPEVMSASRVKPEDVVGIGLDFTTCTMLPVDKDKKPLCEMEKYRSNPHAYAKLWKHHGAQKQTERINNLLKKRGEIDETRYGGGISLELLLPKILQIADESPEIYIEADQMLEAGDWLIQTLSGQQRRSGDLASYKGLWDASSGYPPKDFLKELNPLLENLAEEKLQGDIVFAGESAGTLRKEWAQKLGLRENIALGPAITDSHAGMPGSGISRMDQMMLVVGTSSVMLAMSDIPYARCGVVCGNRGAIMPDKYVMESGLAAVGDMLGWFVEQAVPQVYHTAAATAPKSIHNYLEEKAALLSPGGNGLVALDWWNGNKTPYVDGCLSGALVGCTLSTRPEEIYRALIEATAFGTREVVEEYREGNPAIQVVVASGGIAEKNALFMQIYADVLNMDIYLSAADQTAALGSAIYAAAAAGKAAGGYESIADAAEKMSHLKEKVYHPIPENVRRFQKLYDIYRELVRMLGPEHSNVMHALSELRFQQDRSE